MGLGVKPQETLAPESAQPSPGRPPVGISFNSTTEMFVGINLGVRRTQIGATDLRGKILWESEFETPAAAGAALDEIKRQLETIRARFKKRELKVVGVSVPGVASAERDCLLYAPHLGWRDVAIAENLRSVCSPAVPIVVENDATAAAMFEARLRLKNGAADWQNFILLRSGTGIGVGLILDGEIYRGAEPGAGLAGEFGHMTIVAGGKSCVCGNRGCWEKYAAAAAAAIYTGDRFQIGSTPAPRFVEIVARAAAGETRARRTLERLGEYLGIGISNVIVGLGVPRVVLSGRLVYGWQFIKPALFAAVNKSLAGKLSDWRIECGTPEGSALGGALEVAAEECLMRDLRS